MLPALQILLKPFNINKLRFFKNNQLLGYISELPDIARPAIGDKKFACLIRKSLENRVIFRGKFRNKLLKNRDNISLTLTKRWQLNFYGIQAIVKIFPETPLFNHLPEVFICGGDYTNI